MDETPIIRGRKVVFERPDPVETLRYSIDVFDERDNLVEVLGHPRCAGGVRGGREEISRQAHLPASGVPRDPQQRPAQLTQGPIS